MFVTIGRHNAIVSKDTIALMDVASPSIHAPFRVRGSSDRVSLVLSRASKFRCALEPRKIQKTIEPKSVHILRLAVRRNCDADCHAATRKIGSPPRPIHG